MNVSRLLAVLCAALMLPLGAMAQDAPRVGDPGPELDADKDYYAAFHTSKGTFVASLFADEMPITVRNFVNLADGTKISRHPRTQEVALRRYYDNTRFHRIIDGFMTQGGDPLGEGTGNPGYTIRDEKHPSISFADTDYLLAMARTGAPNSAGAQFFVTAKESFPAHLDATFAVFGRVVQGHDIADAINTSPVRRNPRGGEMSLPVEPVELRAIQIIRMPKGSSFDSELVWDVAPDQAYTHAAEAPAEAPTPVATPEPQTQPVATPPPAAPEAVTEE